MHWWFSWVCFAFWPQVLTFSGSTAQGLNLTWREVSPQLVGAMVFSHQPWPVTLINPSWPKYWKEKLRGGQASCKRDHLETFINMPVFPRSPKDSRKIVKMKREVPVAQFHLSWGAPCICSKKERALAPKPCPRASRASHETLNRVMKYIFIWPVKGAELLYTRLLNLWQMLITHRILVYAPRPFLRC